MLWVFSKLDILKIFFYWLTQVNFNPLQHGVAFLYPLKTSGKLKVFWCFQGYRKATPGCNRLSSDNIRFLPYLLDLAVCTKKTELNKCIMFVIKRLLPIRPTYVPQDTRSFIEYSRQNISYKNSYLIWK